MSNRFVERATAGDFGYCGEPGYCTKCLWRFHRDFINPIEQARGEPPTDLTKVSLHEFLLLRGWREHLADELLTLYFRVPKTQVLGGPFADGVHLPA